MNTILVPLAMFGWIPVVLVIFATQPARRAVCIAYIVGWLFLPIFSYDIHGLPEYDKMAATNLVILFAVALFDRKRLTSFRPGWPDLTVVAVALSPVVSSLSNGLGLYDGLSAASGAVIHWGIPFFIGRVYFSDRAGLRALAQAIVVGGVLYLPLGIFEMIFGPELHRIVYGYYQQNPIHAMRFGGWRPLVFMRHGLMYAVWMLAAALSALWLWRTGAVRRLGKVPMAWIALALLAVTVLARSGNAWLLLMAGLAVLLLHRWRLTTPLLWLLFLAIPLYLAVRATELWSGDEMVTLVGKTLGAKSAASLGFRLKNENLLAAKALEQPIFGWGGWGRQAVYDETRRRLAVTDSLWIIAFGKQGAVGLAGQFTLLLLPSALFLRRHPVNGWSQPSLAPAAVLSLILLLYTIDNLANAMENPIYMLAAGGLISLHLYDQESDPGAADH